MTGPESIAPERHWARYYELSGSRTTRRVIREKLIAARVGIPITWPERSTSAPPELPGLIARPIAEDAELAKRLKDVDHQLTSTNLVRTR